MLHVLLESEGFESSVVPVPGWPDQARIVVGWRRALGIRIFLARFVSEHEFPLE